MDKNPFTEKEKYYPLLMKNYKIYDKVKKNKESDIKSNNKNIDKMIYFLSDKKERNSFTFFKTFIGNADDLSNNILNKKLIKVNTDNKSKSKNKKYNSSCFTNSIRSSKPKAKSKFNIKEKDLSMNQKINKFESRIDNLLNVINDFELKFINSPQTQKIKEEFNSIMNKKIYKDVIANNNLCKTYNNNDNSTINKNDNNNDKDNNNRIEMKNAGLMDINSINININNNNYENNYFITHSINDIGHNTLKKKKNFSDYKLGTNTNSSAIKKSNFKVKKKIGKCNSNELKNQIIHNYKEKTKLFKLPLDSINANNNNNNYIKNNRYNNSYKELQMPLTDRKEKEIDDNKNIEANELRNSLKNINRKKNNCIRINKAASSKNEIRRKTFIKKDECNKVNLFKNKKKYVKKNLTPSSAQGNPKINNTMNQGLIKEHGYDFTNRNKDKDKEKSVNGSAEYIKMRKKDCTDLINYILNKRNIIKNNNGIFGNQHDVNKDYNYNKKLLYKKK